MADLALTRDYRHLMAAGEPKDPSNTKHICLKATYNGIFYLGHYQMIDFTVNKWKRGSETYNRLIYFYFYFSVLLEINTETPTVPELCFGNPIKAYIYCSFLLD